MVTESKRGFLSYTHNFPWRKAKGNLLKRKQLETRFISVFHVEINFLFSLHHLHLHTFPPAYIIFLHTFKRMYVTTYVLTSFPLLFFLCVIYLLCIPYSFFTFFHFCFSSSPIYPLLLLYTFSPYCLSYLLHYKLFFLIKIFI